jgi:hypothetical protein
MCRKLPTTEIKKRTIWGMPAHSEREEPHPTYAQETCFVQQIYSRYEQRTSVLACCVIQVSMLP